MLSRIVSPIMFFPDTIDQDSNTRFQTNQDFVWIDLGWHSYLSTTVAVVWLIERLQRIPSEYRDEEHFKVVESATLFLKTNPAFRRIGVYIITLR